MTKKNNPNEIIGVLTTCVVRSKVESKGNRSYIIDLKIVSSEPSDAMFKLESKLRKLVSVNIETKQLEFGEKFGN